MFHPAIAIRTIFALAMLGSAGVDADPSQRFSELNGQTQRVRAGCGFKDSQNLTSLASGADQWANGGNVEDRSSNYSGAQARAARSLSPGGDVTTASACGEEGKKEFVALVADAWYRWPDELADINPDDYSTADQFLYELTRPLATDGSGRDPGFSYLTTRAADEARGSTGGYVGFGFSFRFDEFNRFLFSDVFQGSPAAGAGFARGDQVLAIDTGKGYETIQQLAARNATFEEMFGASKACVERGFRVLKNNVVTESTLVKLPIDTPPLAVEPKLIERPGNYPVGYLNLRSFILTANDALEEAVVLFKEAGVTDLVIDLRYNGGGLLSVADVMLDLLGGLAATGEDSWRITHNEARRSEDFGAVFAAVANSMQPLRIAFITSNGTASASELVINSLAPHIEVVLIGEDTLGKAVGQYAFDQNRVSLEWASCDTRLRLVTFDIVNGEGQGEYFNGLYDTVPKRFTLCPAADDISRSFGDPAEASLSEALHWLNNGSCSNSGSLSTQRDIRGNREQQWDVVNVPDAPFDLSPWIQ